MGGWSLRPRITVVVGVAAPLVVPPVLMRSTPSFLVGFCLATQSSPRCSISFASSRLVPTLLFFCLVSLSRYVSIIPSRF